MSATAIVCDGRNARQTRITSTGITTFIARIERSSSPGRRKRYVMPANVASTPSLKTIRNMLALIASIISCMALMA